MSLSEFSSSLPYHAAKRRRLSQQHKAATAMKLTSLPVETILAAASFLDYGEALIFLQGVSQQPSILGPMMKSCMLWKQIAQSFNPLSVTDDGIKSLLLSDSPFLTVLLFLDPEEFMDFLAVISPQPSILGPVLKSCTLWKEIAQNADSTRTLDDVIESLLRDGGRSKSIDGKWTQTLITDYPDRFVFPANHSSKSNLVAEMDEASLWRRCVLSRIRSQSQLLKEDSCQSEPFSYPTMLRIQDPDLDLPAGRHRPKSLGAYSFLMDIVNVHDPKKGCTMFYENIEKQSIINEEHLENHVGGTKLSFWSPEEYFPYGPWMWDDERIKYIDGKWTYFLDHTWTVYAIDRCTGKQAKIFHSGRKAMDHGCFRFPEQDCGTNDPVPCLSGTLYGGTLQLTLSFRIKDKFHRRTNGEDMLLFLEKGRVYV